jgi:hypothetical protein
MIRNSLVIHGHARFKWIITIYLYMVKFRVDNNLNTNQGFTLKLKWNVLMSAFKVS